jgi:hypothetical protein
VPYESWVDEATSVVQVIVAPVVLVEGTVIAEITGPGIDTGVAVAIDEAVPVPAVFMAETWKS